MLGLHNTVVTSVPSSFQNENENQKQKHLQNGEIAFAQLFPPSPLQPSFGSVVIGKGKVPRKAPGNCQLRSLVQRKLQDYVNAKSKPVKSSIVTNIYFTIQESCFQEGGPSFVRYDGRCYMEVPESVAREKITSTFRNCLYDRYKSSSKNKVAKRRLANKEKKAGKERKIPKTQRQQLLQLPIDKKSSSQQQQDQNIRTPLPQLPMSSSIIQQQDKTLNYVNHYVPQLPLSSSTIQANKIESIYCRLPPQFPRNDTFAEPILEFLEPIDKSIFDSPLPALDCASTSSTYTESDVLEEL